MPRSPRLPRHLRLPAGLALLALLAGSLVAPTTPAAADDPFAYGYTGGRDRTRRPDSRDHWHCKRGFPLHHDWLDSAMSQLDNQTVLERHDSASCGPKTDVVWKLAGRNSLDRGEALGQARCVAVAFWGVCDSYEVLIDQRQLYALAFQRSRYDPGAWYRINLQLVIRHELGHTAGLHHGPMGVLNTRFGTMVSATVPRNHPRWLEFLAYAPFHAWLINAHN